MSNVRNFGAVGDGVADDTEAIRHAVTRGDRVLHFPPGTYRITGTIEISLEQFGPLGIDGTSGTARIVMEGAGPALRLIGTHGGTGDPLSVKGNVYPAQRLPTIQNLEIEGAHPEADGIELVRTMQSVFEGVLIRKCRHGMHLVDRNRNVLISHCHIYHNRGAGIFLDGLNLHQINIVGNHISYNRLGGIRIERSEIRNLQITGNDIEYNNHAVFLREDGKTEPEPTAEIYVDCTAEKSSVAEVTIASNTIQATVSPGGCNIRVIGVQRELNYTAHLWSISGNVIGSQENNVHLTGCQGFSIGANCIYSCGNRNLLIEESRQITVSGNMFRRHAGHFHTGVRIVRSSDVTFTGCSVHDEHPEGQPTGASLLEIVDADRINVTGSQFLDGVPCGIDVSGSRDVVLQGNTIHDTRAVKKSQHAIRMTGAGARNLIGMNSIGEMLGEGIVVKDGSKDSRP